MTSRRRLAARGAAALLVGWACAGCALERPPEAPLTAQVFKRGEPARELTSGDPVVAGDELYMILTVASRRALHVYVLSEDASRLRQVLYPCRGWERSRPLARRRVRLPPKLLGRETFWPVRTATAHEHLLVLFSARPVAAFEDAVTASDASPCAATLSVEAGRWLDDLSIVGLAPGESSRGTHRGSWNARPSGQEGGILDFDLLGAPDRV